MKRLGGLLALLALAVPATAQADTVRHKLNAPSSVTVQIGPDKDVMVETTTSAFEVYQHWPANLMDGPLLRLAKTTVQQRHEEGAAGKVSVTVSDITKPKLREIVRFSDPGGSGRIVGQRYFVSTEPGCCASPPRHHVRLLETGKTLFSSTGSGGDAGTAIWMSVPNAKPTVERWVAFDGEFGRKDYGKSQRLGVIRYGDWNGALSTVALRAKSWSDDPESAERQAHGQRMESLASCGTLAWIESGKHLRPTSESCTQPGGHPGASLFSIERKTAPADIGGFAVELSSLGIVYAMIPIERDRLDLARALVVDGLMLVEETAR